MNLSLLMLAAAQLAPATAPMAPSADTLGFDIRCMVVTQVAADQAEGELKSMVQLATMYYFGRVDAQLSAAELERRLDAEAKALEGQPLGPVLERCGAFMETRGEALQEIGARLENREQARQIQ